MSTPLTPELLHRTAATTLRDAAFFFTQPMTEPLAWPKRVLVARLSFDGTQKGVMRLVVTPAFGIELAANLLGIDPGDVNAAAEARAAVGELLNMICGALVAQWFGTDVVCQLGIPEVVEMASAELDQAKPQCGVALAVEEQHRVELQVLAQAS